VAKATARQNAPNQRRIASAESPIHIEPTRVAARTQAENGQTTTKTAEITINTSPAGFAGESMAGSCGERVFSTCTQESPKHAAGRWIKENRSTAYANHRSTCSVSGQIVPELWPGFVTHWQRPKLIFMQSLPAIRSPQCHSHDRE